MVPEGLSLRGWRGRLLAGAAVVCLGACGNIQGHHSAHVRRYVVSGQPAPPAQQVLRRSLIFSPRTLDPTLAEGDPGLTVIADLFEGLITNGPGGSLRPGVASSWAISPDGRTYLFHLRPDARWSNGEPVTAADFVYAWRREVNPKSAAPLVNFLAPIVNAQAITAGKKPPSALGVVALDAHTLRVRLTHRTPYFLGMLNWSFYMPEYPAAVRRWGEAWTRPDHMVCDGPFRLTAWVINDHLTLRKNPDYWDAAHVRLREEIDYPISSGSSAVSRYLAGGLDLDNALYLPPTDIDWLRAALGTQMKISPWLASSMLLMRLNEKPFDNPDLRLALSLVLNRKVLAEKLLHGLAQPAYSLNPPMPAYVQPRSNWAYWPMRKRLVTARRLYRAAGYSQAHPLRATLFYSIAGTGPDDIVQAVIAMWHQSLGADITARGEQFKVYLQDTAYRNAKLYIAGYSISTPTPYMFEKGFTKGGLVHIGYDDAAYRKTLRAALAEPNRAARYALYSKAERILEHDTAFIPLYFEDSRELVKPYVAGYKSTVADTHLARYMWIRRHSVKRP